MCNIIKGYQTSMLLDKNFNTHMRIRKTHQRRKKTLEINTSKRKPKNKTSREETQLMTHLAKTLDNDDQDRDQGS
jgi:hypothetical protein